MRTEPSAAEDLTALLARCTFPPPGTRVDCAVSGGADSLTLLALASAADCRVTAIHIDHGLRPGSADEAQVVAAAAERFGAAFRAVRVDLSDGPNLEARARVARYGALPADVMTGHTADDQAETMLLNLLRGAGPEGMAGMRPGCRRPILALRRHDTRALVEDLGLRPVEDPSNDDLSFRRNRVRAELLPLLIEIMDRDPVPVLTRQAGLFRAMVDHLGPEVDGVDPTDARALAAAPEPVAAEAIRRWLRTTNTEGHPPDRATVNRVLAVARCQHRATDIGRGWRVRRSGGRLHLLHPPDGVPDER